MTTKIAKPSSMTLSTSKYTYNGKVRKPFVKVKYSDGSVISSSNYSVTYKNNRNPGRATVTVTFKGSCK